MKSFLADFLDLLANCVLVICLAFASFLLIINFYHFRDLTRSNTSDHQVIYSEYKKDLAAVDKKMKSVKLTSEHDNTAKPIFAYYSGCKEALEKGTFAKLEGKSITVKDIYDANDEILKTYNNKCIFYIPYNITTINKRNKPKVSFNNVFKRTEEKRKIIIDNAEYLTKAGLGNSSYSFTTDTARSTIYNKLSNEYRLTINNYKLMVSILDDVANWYVSEYGGNS